jgi:hypothetical protein
MNFAWDISLSYPPSSSLYRVGFPPNVVVSHGPGPFRANIAPYADLSLPTSVLYQLYSSAPIPPSNGQFHEIHGSRSTQNSSLREPASSPERLNERVQVDPTLLPLTSTTDEAASTLVALPPPPLPKRRSVRTFSCNHPSCGKTYDHQKHLDAHVAKRRHGEQHSSDINRRRVRTTSPFAGFAPQTFHSLHDETLNLAMTKSSISGETIALPSLLEIPIRKRPQRELEDGESACSVKRLKFEEDDLVRQSDDLARNAEQITTADPLGPVSQSIIPSFLSLTTRNQLSAQNAQRQTMSVELVGQLSSYVHPQEPGNVIPPLSSQFQHPCFPPTPIPINRLPPNSLLLQPLHGRTTRRAVDLPPLTARSTIRLRSSIEQSEPRNWASIKVEEKSESSGFQSKDGWISEWARFID